MVVDIKVSFIFSTCLKTLNSCVLVVNDRVDGKGNHEDETMEFRDIMITSVRIIGLLLLLAGVFLLLLQLDDGVFFLFKQLYDVMRLGFFSPARIEELLSEGIHGVTNFHGLLHLNVLAIHSVVDHQHTCA